ncbi:MAG: alpha/beta fold hydrolase [Acidimicrobiales bacterium]
MNTHSIEMFSVRHNAALPERALLLCGLDAVAPIVTSLASALVSEPGWVTAAAILDTSRDASSDTVSAGLRAVADWIDQFTDQSRCTKVWICGFGILGSLAILYAAGDEQLGGDERVRGVACVGVEFPATGSGRQPEEAEEHGQPEEPVLRAALRFTPRPLLIIHGLEDAVTLPDRARALAGAAGEEASLRLLAGAGHDLHADPRVVALLIGWMDQNAL